MKLSELLTKPFKVKGGGFLNLKGFSKRVIDEEIGGSEDNNDSISFMDSLLCYSSKIPVGTLIPFNNTTYKYVIGSPALLPDDINNTSITVEVFDKSDTYICKINFSKTGTIYRDGVNYNVYQAMSFNCSLGNFDVADDFKTSPSTLKIDFRLYSIQNNSGGGEVAM